MKLREFLQSAADHNRPVECEPWDSEQEMSEHGSGYHVHYADGDAAIGDLTDETLDKEIEHLMLFERYADEGKNGHLARLPRSDGGTRWWLVKYDKEQQA